MFYIIDILVHVCLSKDIIYQCNKKSELHLITFLVLFTCVLQLYWHLEHTPKFVINKRNLIGESKVFNPTCTWKLHCIVILITVMWLLLQLSLVKSNIITSVILAACNWSLNEISLRLHSFSLRFYKYALDDQVKSTY